MSDKIKAKKTVCVQIREDAFQVIEEERQAFFDKHNIVASYCDIASKLLVDYQKSKSMKTRIDRALKSNPVDSDKKLIPKRQQRTLSERIIAGDFSFTENQVLSFESYKPDLNCIQIAKKINVSPTTVRTAYRDIKGLLNVDTEEEARQKMIALNVFNIYRKFLEEKAKQNLASS